jgi:hypothetical protein
MSVDIVHCNRCRALLSLLRDGVDQLVLCANPSVSSQSVTGVERLRCSAVLRVVACYLNRISLLLQRKLQLLSSVLLCATGPTHAG